MRYHHACRTSMFGHERFVIIFQSDKGLSVDYIGERYIRSVTTIAKCSNEHGVAIQFGVLKQSIEADAFPFHVEMSPLGDAGDIHNIFLHRELKEFLPRP